MSEEPGAAPLPETTPGAPPEATPDAPAAAEVAPEAAPAPDAPAEAAATDPTTAIPTPASRWAPPGRRPRPCPSKARPAGPVAAATP